SLDNLKYITKISKPQFILKEKYKNDSMLILENIFSDSLININIVWSDSFYSHFSINGISTIIFEMNNGIYIKKILKTFNKNVASVINDYCKSEDTISLKSKIN